MRPDAGEPFKEGSPLISPTFPVPFPYMLAGADNNCIPVDNAGHDSSVRCRATGVQRQD